MSSPGRVLFGVLAACAALCGRPGTAWAGDALPGLGEGLRFNGFGTLGAELAHAPEGWGFQRDASQPLNDGGLRYDTDSRLGLQLNEAFGQRFEATAQLLLRHRVAGSSPEESLEWAFVACHAAPGIDLRLGRVNPDVFLLSDHRSVGFPHPWVRPNVEFYGLLAFYAIDGADLSISWADGSARWRAKLFGGTGHTRVPNPAAGDSDSIDYRLRWLFGLVLSREADGLLTRATLSHYRGSFALGSDSRQATDALAGLAQAGIPGVSAEAGDLLNAVGARQAGTWYLALGARWDHANWLASGEAAHIITDSTYTSVSAAYASLGRRFGPLTAFTIAGWARSNQAVRAVPQWQTTLAPSIGPEGAGEAQMLGEGITALANSMRVDQHTVSFGLRWDVHPRAALKLQWDHTRIDDNGSVLWAHATPEGGRAEVFSVLLDFVF